MSSPAENAADLPELAVVNIRLAGGGWALEARVEVPTWPIRAGELLPLARGLCDLMVGRAVRAVGASGARISCKAGCAACCRMLVPVSETEARRLREVVGAMPEPRRSHVLARFAEAVRQLDAGGLLPQLQRVEQWTDDDFQGMMRAYFERQIACPFLEEESCSIYEERPVTCREHLVVSPAEKCARPATETIERVRIPLPMFNALARLQAEPAAHCRERWVPLTLALEWTEAHPDEPPPRPGVELLRELLAGLKGDAAAPAAPAGAPH